MTFDPLINLVVFLQGSGSLPPAFREPPLTDQDPVSAAWAVSTSPWSMVRLLQIIRSADAERAAEAWTASAAESGHPPIDVAPTCPHCAEGVRAEARAPTLQDVLSALQSLGDEAARAWDLGEDPAAMLDAAVRAGADHRLVVRAVCACVRQALNLAPEADTRSHRALAITERWAAGGEVTRPELYNAAAAAREAADTAARQVLELPGEVTPAHAAALAASAAAGLAHVIAFDHAPPLPLTGHAVELAAFAIARATRSPGDDLGPESPAARDAAAACARVLRAVLGTPPGR